MKNVRFLPILLFCLPVMSGTAQSITASPPGYWHTDGTHIVDARGIPVRIAGVTWYGMESAHWAPGGLNFQPYTVIMREVKLLGFNTIRLPISNEMVERNPVVTDSVAANPGLRGLHALQVLDDLVQYAGRIGLRIVLDDHRSRAARPLEVNSLDEPLWYTRAYPHRAWLNDWMTLARRYGGNPTVVGFDLRNEPHAAGPGPWNLRAYLAGGATWGPYHGIENPSTDWRLAAEEAGDAVLGIEPRLLVFVEGLQLYPDSREPDGVVSSWWSGVFRQVRSYPIRLRVPHQLVYSPHDWGPLKWRFPWFHGNGSAALEAVWWTNWAFIALHPHAAYAAPIWLGEFGTCITGPSCVADTRPASQGLWFATLLGFLRQHSAIGWSFYALNGTNANDCATNNGLLNAQWNRVSSLPLEKALGTIVLSKSRGIPVRGPLIPGGGSARKPRSPESKLCRLP